MATWDGSHSEPDGSNYLVKNNRHYLTTNFQSWDYCIPNINSINAQNTISYSIDTSNFYNSIDKNDIPSVSNITQSNTDISNEVQTFTNKIHESSKTDFNTNIQLPCFNEIQQSSYYNENNFERQQIFKDINTDYQALCTIQHSNLQANANEFIPNNNYKKEKYNKNGKIRLSGTFKNENAEKPSKVFFEDNRTKYDIGFQSNKNLNKKWRDIQNTQYSKDNNIDFRNRNFRKYQNEYCIQNKKLYNNEENNQYKINDMENNDSVTNRNSEQEKFIKEFKDNCISGKVFNLSFEMDNDEQYTKNSKPLLNNSHGDKYINRKGQYNSRNFKDSAALRNFKDTGDFRDRKHNFSECNQFHRNYNKNKYGKRENRNKNITDWRQQTNDVENKSTLLRSIYHKKYEFDEASQRERLTDQLNRGQLECLVCCDFIRQIDFVWSCKNCYHVLHLKCLQKWAMSSQDDNGWRCPACQNVTSDIPSCYECFCGKIRMPDWNRYDIAHSCGETCGRIRADRNCVHKCTLLCHPGSCPPCSAMITKFCGCGKISQTQKCSSGPLLKCNGICNKLLNCGIHKCENNCHHGNCKPCDKIIKQECFCTKYTREKTCTLDLPLIYSCKSVCNKMLDCNNHKCKKNCHPGECGSCILKPETITICCCSQTILSVKRKNCLEPIPTCHKVCGKRLKCGQPSNPHTCEIKCHEGECPNCEQFTKVKCRCGYMDKEIPCKELITKADDARCEKKCVKKRSCGKHKCNQMCCIDIEHICPLPCSKYLSCGRHKCEQTCHRGRCLSCWRSSFDELYCECGATVIYPPVACGTRRPICDKPCSRNHPCSHEIFHNCHADINCPPCTILTQKWCYGKHELRKAVPCYVNEVSCGLACGKPATCGRHKCIQTCHPGVCEKPGYICVQPCTNLRELCGHSCAAPCHEGKCPDVPCKEMVKVSCQCGNRTMFRMCAENSRDYQRIISGILASKIADMQLGHSINLEEVFGQGSKKQNQLKTLDCNDECKIIDRNRRLTVGLQIENADVCGKLIPKYSEHMRQWAKKDPVFCQMVHNKLTELVQLAKISKQKSRSYSFESMNRDKRHFVHELCEHFGCESHAYDQEPKRNVVATAVKDKCWLPSYSLMELLQRENGQRKVPGPTLNKLKLNTINSSKNILQINKKKHLMSTLSVTSSKTPEPEIDYFNYKNQ